MEDDKLTIEQQARKWALHLACTADLQFRKVDVIEAAQEFTRFMLDGTLPARLLPPVDRSPCPVEGRQQSGKRWYA